MRLTLELPVRPSTPRRETPGFPDEGPAGPSALDGGVRLPTPTLEHLIWFGVVIVGFVMRLWNVGNRAMHHDESMHAFYSLQLFKGGGYQYNPLLHGPFQFHAMALMYFIFGVSETSARLTAVVCGTIIVGAAWFLRPHLGKMGAIFTGALFAISPGFLYFSRFAREDIYVACFTLLMVVGMFGWLHSRKPRYIYLLFTATALAFATKESTFITLFIFGTFLIGVVALEFVGYRPVAEASVPESGAEYVLEDDGPSRGIVTQSLLAIPQSVWVKGLICFAAVTVALFTTFLTNNHGLIDAFTSSLQYWLGQQNVHRGDQPPYYYALILPAYEQIPVLFGVIGICFYVFRRWYFVVPFLAAILASAEVLALTAGTSLATPVLALVALVLGIATIYFGVLHGRLFSAFLAYWAVMAFIIYSWAGEKMPWLSIHIAMPLIILAGMFLGEMLGRTSWDVRRWVIAVAAVGLGLFTIHADWPLNYYRGDVPDDMLIYTQTTPQVKTAVAQINALSNQLTGGTDMKILVDNSSTWPFAWYLRDYKNLSYQATLSTAPDQPVVITAVENDAQDKPQLTNYVGNRYKLRWWFPEDYRGLTFNLAVQTVTDAARRKALWNWLTLRELVSPLGSYDFEVWIRKDLATNVVSNLDFVQQQQQAAAPIPAPQEPDPFAGRVVKVPATRQYGAAGQGDGQLNGARGVAIGPDGASFVADQGNNRIEKFDATGKFVAKWGSKGTGDGQFDTPSGIAVDKAGNVWVSDLWNHRVQEFDGNGKFLLKFGSYAAAAGAANPGSFFGPRGIAVGPSGDVYVSDTGNKRIQKFSSAGKFESVWGQDGTGPAQFREPMGITVDQQGSVYVADTWNRRIQKFDANGTFQSQISVGSWPSAQAVNGEPFLAVEPNGVIVASDPIRSRILAFNPTGGLLSAWGGSGNDASSLSAPTGIAVNATGDVVVSDSLNGRLVVFPAPK